VLKGGAGAVGARPSFQESRQPRPEVDQFRTAIQGTPSLGPFSSGRERSALGESDVEAAGEFEDEGVAISASAAADASPAVLALFALLWLRLLVGLAGGLRALHGRNRGG
jgi:hypothetical protein